MAAEKQLIFYSVVINKFQQAVYGVGGVYNYVEPNGAAPKINGISCWWNLQAINVALHLSPI